jgi:cell wall-associated NlpC family hydrolase
VVAKAFTLLGNRYQYGGASPATGFDCAGLVRYVFRETCRLALPTSATLQFQWGLPIGKAALRAGDLVFFRSSRLGWHVGLYVGDGKFIHAPNRRRVVSVNLLDEQYYRAAFRGARRLFPQAPLDGVNAPTLQLDERLLEHSSNPPANIRIPFPTSAGALWDPGS